MPSIDVGTCVGLKLHAAEDKPLANIALKGLFDRKGLDPSLFGA